MDNQREVPEEMHELLQHMQQTSALLLRRIEQLPSAPPQQLLSTPGSTLNNRLAVSHSTPGEQRSVPGLSSRSWQLPAPVNRILPATHNNSLSAPLSHTSFAQRNHTSPAPRSHTSPAPRSHTSPAPRSHTSPAPHSHTSTTPHSHLMSGPHSLTASGSNCSTQGFNSFCQPQPDNVQAQLSRLFRRHQGGHTGLKKRKRDTPWSHIFICLPDPLMNDIPTAEESRFYINCGLGRKMVWFPHNEGDHSYFCEHLLSAFPPLKDAGGFVLARGSKGKLLEEMPIPPEGYTLSYVRSMCTRAPLYVVPLQRSLAITHPSADEGPKVMEICLTCQSSIPLCDLVDHIQECTGKEESRNAEEDMDEELAMAIHQSLQQQVAPVQRHEFQEQSPIIVIEDLADVESISTVQEHAQEPTMVDWDEPRENLEDEGTVESPDLKTVLENLAKGLDTASSSIQNSINVCREFLLEGSFRAFRRSHFNPCERVMVTFVDDEGQTEGAVDDGGPSREYMRLLITELKDSRYFEGPEGSRNLSVVPRALDNGDYKLIGQMLSLALLQGGVQPSFFSPRLYALLCRQPTGPVQVEEVGDWELRQHLEKIKDAENLEDAQRAVDEASVVLHSLGCSTTLQDMEGKQTLLEEAAKAHIEGRCKDALHQLIQGLDCLGLAEAMKANPGVLQPIFVAGHTRLCVPDMTRLFQANLSPPGSNARRSENMTVSWWRDWLIDVGDGLRTVSLEKILIFASGVDQIPPLGFPQRPQLAFLHPPENGPRRKYPEANTCSVILRLPIHSTYEDFVAYMESGIIQSPTFGLI